jgi:hypothetical protein
MKRLLIPFIATLAFAASSFAGTIVYQTVNAGLSPGFFYWGNSSGNIGWYWTPSTDVQLDAIETVLGTASNINNNFTLTTALYTDRPAVSGSTLLGSYTANASTTTADGYTTGLFATPLSLTGGTTYFIAFSGWDQVLTSSGGGGVNWIDPATQPGAQNLGAGSGYTGTDFSVQMNTTPIPSDIDAPILEFTAETADVTTPPQTGGDAPEPSTLLLTLGVVPAALIAARRKQRT